MQDVMKLYIFALILEIAIFIPYCLKASQFQQSVGDMLLHLADALVHAAPPGLPAIMLFCGFFSVVRLAKKGTQVVFPQILREGSQTTVACFDKTGTLTGSVVGSPVCLPACLSGLPVCLFVCVFTFFTCVYLCITSLRFLAFSP